jgi:hypothetical protein
MTTGCALQNGVREPYEGSNTLASERICFLKRTNEPTYVDLTFQTNPSAGWKWWYFPKDCLCSMR